MKITSLLRILAVSAAVPFAVVAESPDDSSASKQGTSRNTEHLAETPMQPSRDGIVRRSDAVYIYRAGKPVKVASTTTVADGIVVEPDGKVVWRSGKEIMLTEGQMVGFDGTLLKEPAAAQPDRDAIQGTSGARD